MNQDAWERAKAIFGEAIDMPTDRREAYVSQACVGDPQLFSEVMALLQADSSETVLQSPVRPPLGHFLHLPDLPNPQTTQTAPGGFAGAPPQPNVDGPLTGTLIKDRYRIEKVLGRGGFAVTYVAADTQLDSRPVVVKVLLDHYAEDPWVLKKFHQEMRALARLDHPSVVGALDTGQLPDGRPYLVMQFIKGNSLREVINPPRGMDLERAGNIVRQLGHALSAAHQEGICHRDVKPENIMLHSLDDGEEHVKLIDFGIASIRDARATNPGDSTRISGTLAYMAPEQFQGNSSPASDTYSLGVVAYEMVTGRPPFVPENLANAVKLQMEGVKVKPRDLRPALPEGAEAAILKALARNPEARFIRSRDFGEAFVKGVAAPSTITVTTTETHEPSRRMWVPRASLMWAPAVALLIGAGVWISWRQAPSGTEHAAGQKAAPIAQSVTPRNPVPPPPNFEIPKTAKVSPAILKEPTKVATQQPPPAALVAGAVKVNAKDGLRYRWIPPGFFQMGCSTGDTECFDNEKPPRVVTITTGFWIGETEVTQEAYQRVTDQIPSTFKGANLPVETISWYDAQSYCQATGMRLPTEAEWEYAARAGTQQSRYAELAAIAWYGGNSGGKTHEVATKAANAWGLFDTLGNVWEWTADWYADQYPVNSEADPRGSAGGQYRSTRGSSFRVDPRSTRVSDRRRDEPGRRGDFSGVRCAGSTLGAEPVPQAVRVANLKTQTNPRDGLVYIWIPPGMFSMGCSAGDIECAPNEQPEHQVTITKAFWIGQTEVTREAYQRVTARDASTKSQLPVDGKTWDESQAYCSVVGMRLPTEAEWEYAARGGSSLARYGDLNLVAWWTANSGNALHEVGGKQPNGYGLYDTLGNLREWVADWYGADYYRSSPASDPSGPPGGQWRVQRGGAFPGAAGNIRVSVRLRSAPSVRDGAFGFRCAGSEIPASPLPLSGITEALPTH